MKYSYDLYEEYNDLNQPLDKVSRFWIRKPAAIILTIVVFEVTLLLGLIISIIDTICTAISITKKFFRDTYYGSSK